MESKQITPTKDVSICTMRKDGIDYICITDIARQKNTAEPKDIVKNWMRSKTPLNTWGYGKY
jgi:uncharacterized pyridoxamine 5'-phosphate oxidase family protein